MKRQGPSTMFSIVFGQRLASSSSPLVVKLTSIGSRLLAIHEPGATLPLEVFPFFQWIPSRWASWKTKCDEIRAGQRALFFTLVDECDARQKRGMGNAVKWRVSLKWPIS